MTESPKAIVKTSKASADRATSASVRTDITATGVIDWIRGRADGTNQEREASSAQAHITVRTVGTSSWTQGDDKFWQSIGATAHDKQAAQGKWLPLGTDSSVRADTYKGAFLTRFWAQVETDLKAPSTATHVTYAGKPAIRIQCGRTLILIVSADAAHLPISASYDGQTWTFSQWNAVRAYQAPPPAQIIPKDTADRLSSRMG